MILVILVVILLTGMYSLILASFAWEDVALGLVLSVTLLALFRHVLLPSPLPSNARMLRAIVMFPMFAFVAIRDIVTGSWTVALIVVGIRPLNRPGIVAIPIGERSPTAVGMSGMILTLSPGSFLVDVDWDEGVFLIHVIDASDPDAVRETYQTFYDRYQRHVVP